MQQKEHNLETRKKCAKNSYLFLQVASKPTSLHSSYFNLQFISISRRRHCNSDNCCWTQFESVNWTFKSLNWDDVGERESMNGEVELWTRIMSEGKKHAMLMLLTYGISVFWAFFMFEGVIIDWERRWKIRCRRWKSCVASLAFYISDFIFPLVSAMCTRSLLMSFGFSPGLRLKRGISLNYPLPWVCTPPSCSYHFIPINLI